MSDLMGEKVDHTSSEFSHTLQALQAQLALLLPSSTQVPDNKPKGENKVSDYRKKEVREMDVEYVDVEDVDVEEGKE